MSSSEFLWGAATSSYQVEGGILNNDWAAWERSGVVDGGVTCGIAADHRNRFREDLKLAADLGLNSYRFSIEWARVEPFQGEWDEAAIAWYLEVISECEKLGLKPMVTLHHFTLPAWFAELSGFDSDDSPKYFLRYVQKIVEALGERVPIWCTINEPVVLVIGSYLGGFMPPAVFAPKKASRALANLLECHCGSYELIHQLVNTRSGPWKDAPLLVGYAHNVLGFRPERKTHFLERLIAKRAERFYNDAWVLATLGQKHNFKFPFLINSVRQVRKAENKVSCDYIGINYYTKAYIQWWPRSKNTNSVGRVPLGVSFARRNEEASDLDWAINPKAFSKILKKFCKFGLPVIVTENGIADRTDLKRPKYLIDHLKVIGELIDQGLDIRGYYYWSLIDNFEWIKGFWPRFGLIAIDYSTQERTLTRSAHLYKEIISAHSQGQPKESVIAKAAACQSFTD